MNCIWYMDSPVGELGLLEDEKGIRCIFFGGRKRTEEVRIKYSIDSPEEKRTILLDQAIVQLSEYFSGRRKKIDLPLSLSGTCFQKRVWDALMEIPYGETRSYGQIAGQIGNPKGSRAVGMANNKNSIPIVIPCHRVIGADGNLTGYAGGLDIKRTLLHLEGVL